MNPLLNEKITRYQLHVQQCRACRSCGPTMMNPTSEGFGDHPSPWAMWMGNLNGDLVIVGQDFASQEEFHDKPDPALTTNQKLTQYLRAAGIHPSRVYLTNAVLCLKPGSMSAPLSQRWVRNCAARLAQTIETVQPVAVAAVGRLAWRGTCLALRVAREHWSAAVGNDPVVASGRIRVFRLGHCGALGLANRKSDLQRADWVRLADWMRGQGVATSEPAVAPLFLPRHVLAPIGA